MPEDWVRIYSRDKVVTKPSDHVHIYLMLDGHYGFLLPAAHHLDVSGSCVTRVSRYTSSE